ncbi:MAG: translation elongation factor Ts [Clostridiales bacterium]|nr:translation elongation factor Ts [Clostridiales bacterium]
MATITPQLVKELRERTGAGMMDCKKALEATGGDIEEAIQWLRKKGLSQAAKLAERTAKEGLVGAYIHGGGRIGVLVEISCETDFVARTEDFQELVKDVAMHIAASNPRFIRREDVPEEVLRQEQEIQLARVREEGKPEHVAQRIVEGRMAKFFEEVCLLEQPFVKDPQKTVAERVQETSAKLGEKIEVRRFARFEVGR